MRLLVFGLFVIASCAQADEKPLVAVPAFDDDQAAIDFKPHDSASRRFEKIPVIADEGVTAFGVPGSLDAVAAAVRFDIPRVKLRGRTTRNFAVYFPDPTIELHLDGIATIRDIFFEELQLYSARFPGHRGYRAIPTSASSAYDVYLDMEVGSWTLSERALSPKDFTDVTLPEGLPNFPVSPSMSVRKLTQRIADQEPFKQAFPDGFVVSDPRAILTILKQPPKAVPPLDATPKKLEPAGDLAAFEQIVRAASRGEQPTCRPNVEGAKGTKDQEQPVTARLALVRLTIYAPSRVIALAPQLAGSKDAATRRHLAWCLGMIAKHRRELVTAEIEGLLNRLLYDSDSAVRAEAAEACGRARLVTAAPVIAEELHKQVLPADPQEAQIDSLRQTIENRAKLAQALGFLGVKSPEVIDALEDLVRQPTVHPDPNWSRLDGGLAAWALGTLQAKEGAGVLKDALLTARSFRPMASENVNKSEAVTRGLPIDRVHWFAAFALAEIGTDEALIGLETAMNSPPDPELVENDRLGGLAARALARFRVESRAPILAKLLVHENSLVRRAGVLGCLQETDPACRTLLELGASWAVPWWDVQHAKP